MAMEAENNAGKDSTHVAKPADTNAATIYSVPTGVARAQLLGMNIVNNGAANVTVSINNGSADYQLLWSFSLPANEQRLDTFGNPVMQSGWSLKVQTSNADDTSFVATIRETVI